MAKASNKPRLEDVAEAIKSKKWNYTGESTGENPGLLQDGPVDYRPNAIVEHGGRKLRAKHRGGTRVSREPGSFYLLTVSYLRNAHPDWSAGEVHSMAVRVVSEVNAAGAQAWVPRWCADCEAPAEPWCFGDHAIREPELPAEPGSIATLGIAEVG